LGFGAFFAGRGGDFAQKAQLAAPQAAFSGDFVGAGAIAAS
jgi:hypothetical protein